MLAKQLEGKLVIRSKPSKSGDRSYMSGKPLLIDKVTETHVYAYRIEKNKTEIVLPLDTWGEGWVYYVGEHNGK